MSVKVQVSAQGVRELLVRDEPWRPELVDRFRAEACAGLLVGCPGSPGMIKKLDFVSDLEGLRSVRLLKGVRDVSAVFQLSELEVLQLDSAFKGPLSLNQLPALRRLETPFVAGIETVASVRGLVDLVVYGWSAADLLVLGDKPELRFLRVEMKRRRELSLAGVEGAPQLDQLNLYEGSVVDPGRLAALPKLREVAFQNTKVGDLDFVSELPMLRDLELENSGDVESLRPLEGHRALASVVLAGATRVVDGDLNPLLRIPHLRALGIDRGFAGYTHTPGEVRRLVNERAHVRLG